MQTNPLLVVWEVVLGYLQGLGNFTVLLLRLNNI